MAQNVLIEPIGGRCRPIKKEDVKVSVENNVLAISGERTYEKEETNNRVERTYGSFLGAFAVPRDADGS